MGLRSLCCGVGVGREKQVADPLTRAPPPKIRAQSQDISIHCLLT